ncbi:MAG: hypothetical protein NC086_00405 [Alistipes sp.]|nr:hypothetical protein [Alistipes sp.]
MIENTYQGLIGRVGKEHFEARFDELVKQIQVFLEEAKYDDSVQLNERILYHVLLDFYSDIERLKDFHGIVNVKTDKIIAYLLSWFIRRKPIQITECSKDEKDIFVNERFACTLLINECLSDKSIGEIDTRLDDFKLDYYKRYVELLLYYFKYRAVNPQVIELVIESFKVGRLFPVINKVEVHNEI